MAKIEEIGATLSDRVAEDVTKRVAAQVVQLVGDRLDAIMKPPAVDEKAMLKLALTAMLAFVAGAAFMRAIAPSAAASNKD